MKKKAPKKLGKLARLKAEHQLWVALIEIGENYFKLTGQTAGYHNRDLAKATSPVDFCLGRISSPEIHSGLAALIRRGRPDLSIEMVIMRPEFDGLFTDDERRRASDRLRLAYCGGEASS